MYLNKQIKLLLEYLDKFDPVLHKDGVYSTDGIWNNIKWIDGKAYRERVEVLIFNEKGEVFLELKPEKENIGYRIPGGGVEPKLGRSNIEQVYEEAKEETRMLIKNIIDPKITYIYLNPPNNTSWLKEKNLPYIGYFAHVYIAEFDKYFKGRIKKIDSDEGFVKNGKFYPISYLKRKEHIQAANLFKLNRS